MLTKIIICIIILLQTSETAKYINDNQNILSVFPDFKDTQKKHYKYHSKYIVFPNLFSTDFFNDSDSISLILHTSNDKNLSMIEKHIENWNGPISLGVFMENSIFKDPITLCTICNLKKYIKNGSMISVHLIFKNIQDIDDTLLETILNDEKHCREYFEQIPQFDTCVKKPINKYEKIERILNYPINVVKNIARKHTSSKYIIFSNFGNMFSENFHGNILPVAEKKLSEGKNILVVRAFDIDKQFSTIKHLNKIKLKNLVFKGKVYFFEHEKQNQFQIPKLREWFSKKSVNEPIQFTFKEYPHYWNPIFVSKANIDYHIEEINFPSEDSISLQWQLCKNNYNFQILNDVFVYKFGWKNEDEKNTEYQARKIAYKINTKIIKTFKKKFDKKYSKSEKKCYL